MKVKVELLAFGKPEEFREVNVLSHKDSDDLLTTLGKVFYFGQNDFQSLQHPSVSMADVVHLGGEKYLVCAFGFRKMSADEYDAHKAMDRRDRSFNELVQSPNV